MPEKPLPVTQILDMLTGAPPHIAALTHRLTPAQLRTSPADGEWSANEVLAHLRSCADMWGGSIKQIVMQHKPTIRAINPRTWIKETDYLEQEFRPSLEAFTTQRAELVSLLISLPPAGWSRPATITGAGKPLERTVHSYAQWMATHERPHLKQIQRIVSHVGNKS